MPLTGTPVESKGVVQRNLFQSFLGACAFGGTRTWLVLRQISNVLHDKLVEPLKPLIILIEVNNTCWYLGNQAKKPKISQDLPVPMGYIPHLPTGSQVAFEIIDLDRHGEIGATDLRRALQSPDRLTGEKWLGGASMMMDD